MHGRAPKPLPELVEDLRLPRGARITALDDVFLGSGLGGRECYGRGDPPSVHNFGETYTSYE